VRGGETYDWRAVAPNLFVCVLTAICTMRRQDLTPDLAPSQHPCMQPHFTLHSHVLPAHTPAPHSNLCFGYKQPVPGAPLGFISTAAKDRAIPHIHSTHFINTCKHPTPWPSIQKSHGCTPLLPSPKSVRLWGVHGHHTG